MKPLIDRELLKQLALAAGPPGAEDEVRAVARKAVADCGEIRYDRLGSLLCEQEGTQPEPRVVIDGHLDEVSFVVQSITRAGRLQFLPLGSWWPHVVMAQRVSVITASGAKLPGVVGSKPPHFLQPEERRKLLSLESMYIDIGAASAAEVAELGVQVGDPVVPYTEFLEFAGGQIASCKAFDNRVGIGLMCESMKALASIDHPNTVIGVGAAQEEVGCRGAETASALSNPDVAIILEGTPADDLPGVAEPQGILGRGPQIRFLDPSAISSRRLVRLVQEVAADADIPVQLAVRRGGGTNASVVQQHGRGVPSVVIGVPSRYIHTHVTLINWEDYQATLDLLLALVPRLDADTVAGLVAFGD